MCYSKNNLPSWLHIYWSPCYLSPFWCHFHYLSQFNRPQQVLIQNHLHRHGQSLQTEWLLQSSVPATMWNFPDGSVQGTLLFRGKDENISVYCNDAGDKNYWGGERRWYPAGNRGPCYTGESETLIIEWTEVGVKVLRGDEVILSQEWGPTDGHCLKETGFWRIQNIGTTVVSGESILGT